MDDTLFEAGIIKMLSFIWNHPLQESIGLISAMFEGGPVANLLRQQLKQVLNIRDVIMIVSFHTVLCTFWLLGFL